MQLNSGTAVKISCRNRNVSRVHPSLKPPLWGHNRLVLITLWKYIVHLNWGLLSISTRTIVPHLKTGTWFLFLLDSLTDGLSVLLYPSTTQLGLPHKIGVLAQILNLLIWPPLQSAIYICSNVSTAHHQWSICHQTMDHFLGLTWSWSLSSLTWTALSVGIMSLPTEYNISSI